ncbi:RNA polymerase sigma factor SigL [Stieleria neptunia]|uniref:RNA polymerase sigma factor SigL n=1 Tax=Stieleria neptunia TaxID=2527979 RepID=A0A518HJ79_9BACT|nr:sigma-70 family RNA polymerase sigma factor [Stieleria neptunia]QDV40905.1 RNA polymerase sigma factor SigL [Stieleria neptunia]
MPDVTRILSDLEHGDSAAAEQLLPLVYDELRKLAAAKLLHEKPGQTLQATALVHEAYVRLVDQSTPPNWDGRGHFFSAAAEAMRRILVEQARRKKAKKRGGNLARISLDLAYPAAAEPTYDLLALDDALRGLEAIDERKAAVVRLRYFAGLTIPQAAAALGISTSTADNDWAYAKSWLRIELNGRKNS